VDVLVIADDFTGANAAGVLLKKNGMKTTSFLDYRALDTYMVDSKVMVVSSGTRAETPERAYKEASRIFSEKPQHTSVFCQYHKSYRQSHWRNKKSC